MTGLKINLTSCVFHNKYSSILVEIGFKECLKHGDGEMRKFLRSFLFILVLAGQQGFAASVACSTLIADYCPNFHNTTQADCESHYQLTGGQPDSCTEANAQTKEACKEAGGKWVKYRGLRSGTCDCTTSNVACKWKSGGCFGSGNVCTTG